MRIRKKHATRHISSAAPATRHDDGGLQSAAPATKTATHLQKTMQKYCACHTKKMNFRHVMKHVGMSQSATPATRNEATRRLKPPKVTPFAELAHRHGHTALTRPPADGCERKRNVERTHPQPPDRQSETGTFATHVGKKLIFGLLKK